MKLSSRNQVPKRQAKERTIRGRSNTRRDPGAALVSEDARSNLDMLDSASRRATRPSRVVEGCRCRMDLYNSLNEIHRARLGRALRCSAKLASVACGPRVVAAAAAVSSAADDRCPTHRTAGAVAIGPNRPAG